MNSSSTPFEQPESKAWEPPLVGWELGMPRTRGGRLARLLGRIFKRPAEVRGVRIIGSGAALGEEIMAARSAVERLRADLRGYPE